ncbi:hypothetical protein ADUPG1_011007, partial [Aduncisulcus paluster]
MAEVFEDLKPCDSIDAYYTALEAVIPCRVKQTVSLDDAQAALLRTIAHLVFSNQLNQTDDLLTASLLLLEEYSRTYFPDAVSKTISHIVDVANRFRELQLYELLDDDDLVELEMPGDGVKSPEGELPLPRSVMASLSDSLTSSLLFLISSPSLYLSPFPTAPFSHPKHLLPLSVSTTGAHISLSETHSELKHKQDKKKADKQLKEEDDGEEDEEEDGAYVESKGSSSSSSLGKNDPLTPSHPSLHSPQSELGLNSIPIGSSTSLPPISLQGPSVLSTFSHSEHVGSICDVVKVVGEEHNNISSMASIELLSLVSLCIYDEGIHRTHVNPIVNIILDFISHRVEMKLKEPQISFLLSLLELFLSLASPVPIAVCEYACVCLSSLLSTSGCVGFESVRLASILTRERVFPGLLKFRFIRKLWPGVEEEVDEEGEEEEEEEDEHGGVQDGRVTSSLPIGSEEQQTALVGSSLSQSPSTFSDIYSGGPMASSLVIIDMNIPSAYSMSQTLQSGVLCGSTLPILLSDENEGESEEEEGRKHGDVGRKSEEKGDVLEKSYGHSDKGKISSHISKLKEIFPHTHFLSSLSLFIILSPLQLLPPSIELLDILNIDYEKIRHLYLEMNSSLLHYENGGDEEMERSMSGLIEIGELLDAEVKLVQQKEKRVVSFVDSTARKGEEKVEKRKDIEISKEEDIEISKEEDIEPPSLAELASIPVGCVGVNRIFEWFGEDDERIKEEAEKKREIESRERASLSLHKSHSSLKAGKAGKTLSHQGESRASSSSSSSASSAFPSGTPFSLNCLQSSLFSTIISHILVPPSASSIDSLSSADKESSAAMSQIERGERTQTVTGMVDSSSEFTQSLASKHTPCSYGLSSLSRFSSFPISAAKPSLRSTCLTLVLIGSDTLVAHVCSLLNAIREWLLNNLYISADLPIVLLPLPLLLSEVTNAPPTKDVPNPTGSVSSSSSSSHDNSPQIIRDGILDVDDAKHVRDTTSSSSSPRSPRSDGFET